MSGDSQLDDTQARNKIIKDCVMSLGFEHLTFKKVGGGVWMIWSG